MSEEIKESVSDMEKLLKINEEILETNREIAESIKYIRNHFRFELVITGVKWFILVALIIFGVISLGSILAGVKDLIPVISVG